MAGKLCKSTAWNDDELDGLGLLGLQPCFEDVVLLAPIYISFIFISVYRVRQCYHAGSYSHSSQYKLLGALKIFCAAANAAANIAWLGLMDKDPVDYVYLVGVLGIVGWLSVVAMLSVELAYFNVKGQWLSKFCFIWVFVCMCIRYPSQAAIGRISGYSYYFSVYLAMWIPEFLLVFVAYFDKMISPEEYKHSKALNYQKASSSFSASSVEDGGALDEEGIALQEMEADKERKRQEANDAVVKVPIYSAAASGPCALSADEEVATMKPVPWTKSRNPEGNAGFFSRLFFSWMSELFAYAHKHTLEEYDVWDLRNMFRSAPNAEMIEAAWNRERERNPEKPSLQRTLTRTLGWYMFPAMPLLFIQNVAQLVLPALIGPLVRFMDNDEPKENGYIYAACLFGALMVMTISENAYFDICVKTGIRLRAALVPLIYRHACRMSSDARAERSVGAIANHMSADTEKMQMFCMQVNNLWSAPLRIALGLYLLISSLGIAGIFGMVSVAILIPLQGKVMSNFGNYLKKVLQKSDVRIKVLNEVLGGMRVIKYYAWEGPFEDKVKELRTAELSELASTQKYRAINLFFMNLNPVAMSVGTFIAFAALRGNLAPDQAFQALALFQLLIWPLMMFPGAVSAYLETLVAMERLESYLCSSTLESTKKIADLPNGALSEDGFPQGHNEGYVRVLDAKPAIVLEDAYFSWGGKPSAAVGGNAGSASVGGGAAAASSAVSVVGGGMVPCLHRINVTVQPGELLAIVGQTGSGKSSMVAAMIGELNMMSGRAVLCGSIAYVPQQAWIYNASVRDNILFGAPFNQDLYKQTVTVSRLQDDIDKQFENGDETEIGEKGINLSGGQRQRVSIARAVYSDADIYIFDDPLSALDAHVTADVFKDCFKTHLAGKTRVLVTNQLHLMQEVDRIIVMKDGCAIEMGSFDELMQIEGGEFRRLRADMDNKSAAAKDDNDHEEIEDTDADDADTDVLTELASVSSNQQQQQQSSKRANPAAAAKATTPRSRTRTVSAAAGSDVAENGSSVTEGARKRSKSVAEVRKAIKKEEAMDVKDTAKKDAGKLIQQEGHTVGSVKMTVYTGYFNAIGKLIFYSMVAVSALSIGLNLASSVWLGIWAQQAETSKGNSVFYYISIYVALSFASVLCSYVANRLGFAGAVGASAKLHADFVHALLRAPISFFDSTPIGRITNRLAKDMGMIDTIIMFNIQMFLRSILGLFATLVIIGVNTTYVLVPFVPILVMFAAIQNYYKSTNVQLKRLDAVSRSPIYAHFSESLNGMATIRAYLAQDRMSATNSAKLDQNQKVYIMSMTCNRWLSIRLEFLGGLLILITAINCVLLRNSLSASSAGIALAYALQITAQLNLLVRMTTELEGSFNAVERVQEYSNIKPEAALKGPEYPPDDKWPSEGKVEMKDLIVSYREGMEPVLKGLNVVIEPGQKIGVCGRTGAGKSSLFQALFRMMEATSGSIAFDGVDIKNLGLSDVRNAISIIPQDPVLFSGDLRFNLDPFNLYSDVAIWEALDKASLRNVVIQKNEKLALKVAENGENFSVGQRQLLCLARALLRKSKILVLDEATANVDIETDALIQNTIRENFADRTTLTIAHRLNTIIDCDKILVLEFGRVKEFDTPRALLSNEKSEFYSMVAETGEKNAALLKAVAFRTDDALTSGFDEAAKELAANAKRKLTAANLAETSLFGAAFDSVGPMMRAVIEAGSTMRRGWSDRHQPEWTEELDRHNVPLVQWMEQMLTLLRKVQEEADQAMDDDRFDEASVGLRMRDFLSGRA